jgi:hypothetical protein
VDVDRLPHGAVPRIERAGEEAPGACVRVGEHADLAAAVVVAAVGAGRQDGDDAKVVTRWPPQLPRQDLDQLGRPEELTLEVDQSLGGTEGAFVRLENPERSARPGSIDLFRNRLDKL